MKKLMALLLMLCLVWSLSSCALLAANSDSSTTEKAPNVGGEVSEPTPEKGESEETQTPEDSEKSEEPEEVIAPGKAEGGTYKNEYFGVSLTLPEPWDFYDEEQILEQNKLTDELFNGALSEAYENAKTFADMMAADGLGSSVNANVENLGLLYGAVLSEDEYLDLSVKNLPSAFASAGITDFDAEIETAMVGGQEKSVVAIRLNTNGVEVFEKIFCVKRASHVLVVTVGALEMDTVDAVLENFTLSE
ncbi:MAG: hypothetical protein J6J21_04005 [Clostridia bacterium]|nr:hypothetical protein [Clostridia bacterium]